MEERLLLALAALMYLSSGLYLTFFTQGIDFYLVYHAAQNLLHGQASTLYNEFLAFQPGQNPLFYMYPPLVAICYVPFALVPPGLALFLFGLFCQVAFWDSLRLLFSGQNVTLNKKRLLVAMSLLFFPLYYSFHMGQNEAIVLWCLLAAVRFSQRGNDALSSLFLCVAIQLKMFLAFVPLYFLLTRRYRYVTYCLLWTSVGLGLSALWVSPPVLKAWALKLFSPLGIEAFIDNQSLTGFLTRSLTHNVYTRGLVDFPVGARRLTQGISLLLVFLYAAKIIRHRDHMDLETGFGFTLMTTLLIAPHVDTHHFVILLVPFSFLTLAGRLNAMRTAYYAFFATFIPLWAFKFLSVPKGFQIGQGAGQLFLSVPFFVLLSFWIYEYGQIGKMNAST